MTMELKFIYWNWTSEARLTLQDWRNSIQEAEKESTHSNELVPGNETYKGTFDALGKGSGGVWLPRTDPLIPLVWQVEWPEAVH